MKFNKIMLNIFALLSLLLINMNVQAKIDVDIIIHNIEHNETLESIAENYEVSTAQLIEWNDLEDDDLKQGQSIKVLEPGFYSREELRHEKLDKVLEHYEDEPVYIHVESLDSDGKMSSLNGTTYVYGASVPKIVLAAFVLEQVSEGYLDWDDKYQYDAAIYEHELSYSWGGSGIMQYEDYRKTTYTLEELTEMTLKNSDNMASNMLLHFVALEDENAFDQFTREIYKASTYELQVTAKQMSQVMRYIYEHEDDSVKEMMKSTDYDNEKLDVVKDETYQKIGGTHRVNHASAIVEGKHNYVITVLSNFATDDTISDIARDVNDVLNSEQLSNR